MAIEIRHILRCRHRCADGAKNALLLSPNCLYAYPFRLFSYLLISSSTRSRVDGVYSRLGAVRAGASISSNGISIRGVTRLDVCGCISMAHAVRRRFHRSKSSECRRFASSSIQSSNALGLSRLNVSSGIPRAVKAYACKRKMSIFSPSSFFLTLWHFRR